MSSPEEYLIGLGAAEHPHSGRSLFAHLRGTKAILQRWQYPEYVCLAGLFHSVYGTIAFPTACAGIEQRAEIRQLIGAAAERLVFLFCTTSRPRSLITCIQSGELRMRSGAMVAIDMDTLRALLAIEAANLLEQKTGRWLLKDLRAALDADPGLLSLEARMELERSAEGQTG